MPFSGPLAALSLGSLAEELLFLYQVLSSKCPVDGIVYYSAVAPGRLTLKTSADMRIFNFNRSSFVTQKKAPRTWLMVEFDIDTEHEDMASWLMIHKLGANGCELLSPSAGRSTVQASFELDRLDETQMTSVNAALDEYGLGKSVGSLRTRKIEEEDWLAEWKRGFQPLPTGERLLVCPPWLQQELTDEQRARLIILIEPGLAFGTGFHATTQFCLKSLERLKQQRRILDVGTGSGILAIGAALLLADATIVAVEIDPEACRVAAENLRINNVDHRVQLIEGEIETIKDQKFEVILSNLTCEDNVALLPEYLKLLEPSGQIVMSGILEEKSAKMRDAIQQNGLTIVQDETNSGWVGLVVANMPQIQSLNLH